MTTQDLKVQEKQEQAGSERTTAGRYYVPQTDIHESSDALFVTMDVPGVSREKVEISLDKDVLTVTGNIDFSSYDGLKPMYTEYNVGNYSRSFTLSNQIDKSAISARMEDGVLYLKLPKVKETAARKIEVL